MKPLRKEHRLRHNDKVENNRDRIRDLILASDADQNMLHVMGTERVVDHDRDAMLAMPSFWDPAPPHDDSFDQRTPSQFLQADWSAMEYSIDTPSYPLLMPGAAEQTSVNTESFSHQAHCLREDSEPHADDQASAVSHFSNSHPLPSVPTQRAPSGSGAVLPTESGQFLMSSQAVTDQCVDLTTSPGTRPASAPTRDATAAAAGASKSGSDTSSLFDTGRAVRQQINQAGFDWPRDFSLEKTRDFSNHVVGLSSESDPYVLRHYLYDVHDTYSMFRLNFRKIVDDRNTQLNTMNAGLGHPPLPTSDVPVQFMLVDEAIWKDGLRATDQLFDGPSTLSSDSAQLDQLVPPDLGVRLLKLYLQFVHPGFPILSLHDVGEMMDDKSHVGIKSAIFALASPFTYLDDELSVRKGYSQLPTEELWAITQRSYRRALESSHLSLLQLCLLLLQMPPLNFAVAEAPYAWTMSCAAVAIAESLGLNIDPATWRMPKREVMLRRRLWWFTYSQHIWFSLAFGRASHLNDANWDVSPLSIDDFERGDDQDLDINTSILKSNPFVVASCELSRIAADIQREFYTLKAARECCSFSALDSRAQDLRVRIERWRKQLPPLSASLSELSDDDLENCAAIRLSLIAVEVLIFRALLRPLAFQSLSALEHQNTTVTETFQKCYDCAKEATDFVASLKARHFGHDWPLYARYQLGYISAFILLIFAQSPTEEAASQSKALLRKWRDSLRAQARVWPLAKLAAMRLDATFWKKLSAAVHGAGQNSPAVRLLKMQSSQTSEQT